MSEYNEIMKNAKGREKKYAAFDPNKGKKNIIKLSIVCVIALVLLLCILFRKEIMNNYRFGSISPTSHYLKIEKTYVENKENQVKGLIEGFGRKKEKDSPNRIMKVRFDANPDLIEILSAKDINTYGAKNAEVSMEYSSTDDDFSIYSSFKINDRSLFDLITYSDKKKSRDYVRIPQINDAYIEMEKGKNTSIPVVGADSSSINSIMDGNFFENLMKDTEEKQAKLDKLKGVYYDYVKETNMVRREQVTEEVNGVSNKYNLFTVEFTGEKVAELMVKYLELAKKDKEVKDYIVNMADDFETMVGKPLNGTEINSFEIKEENKDEDIVTQHIKHLEEVKESLKSYQRAVVIKMYTDIEDELLGHKIEFNSEKSSSFYFESIKAVKNGRFGSSLVYKKDGIERVNIKGHGSLDLVSVSASMTFATGSGSSKKIIKGSMSGCDLSKIWNGVFNGKITFTSDDIYEGGRMVADIEMNYDDININSALYADSSNIGALTIENKESDSAISNKPDSNSKVMKSSDDKAMKKYAESFEIKKFIKRFSKDAGLTFTYDDFEELVRKFTFGR